MGHEDPWGLHEETSQDAFHLGHVALQNLGVQVGLKIDVAVHTEVHQGRLIVRLQQHPAPGGRSYGR